MTDDRLSFPLETLLSAGAEQLSVCDLGHLIAGHTHWQPVAITADLKSLICDWTLHEAGNA